MDGYIEIDGEKWSLPPKVVRHIRELEEQLKAANEDAAKLYIEAKYARMFNNPALEAHRVRIDAGDYDSSYDGLIPEEKE